jgi:type I restriction enzyme S subunit
MGSAGENGTHDTAMAKGPGIVIGRSGASFGQVHFCPVDYWPHNTVLYVTDFQGNEPRFAYYFLKAIDFARYNSGSAQPSLNRNFVSPIEVEVPGIDEQRAIAHVLGTLDDKIEFNRRMNETLEAIARAIYKSWFVDFDPVRAKASSEPPESICRRLGLTPDLLAHFPDRLVDSELGEIPEGWAAGTIADYCYLNAQSWTERTLPAVVHYVDLANAKNGVVSQVQVFSSSKAPSRARRVLRTGDTIVGTVRPGNRSFALIGEGTPQLTGSTGFAVLTPRRAELRELVYFLATGEENIARLSHLADGAAYPAVRPDVVTAGACVVPSAVVIDAFHDVVSAMVDRQIANQANDTALAAIRDSLLPKLLSGELPVPLKGAA